MSDKRLSLVLGVALAVLLLVADGVRAQQLPGVTPINPIQPPSRPVRGPGYPILPVPPTQPVARPAVPRAVVSAPVVDHSNCAACHRPARALPRYYDPCASMPQGSSESFIRSHLPILVRPALPVVVMPLPRERLATAPEPPSRERSFPQELLSLLWPKDDNRPEKLSIQDLSTGVERSNLSAERAAESKLKLARLLADQGQPEDAQAYYREILARYPQTAAADGSRRALGLAPRSEAADEAQADRARLSKPQR